MDIRPHPVGDLLQPHGRGRVPDSAGTVINVVGDVNVAAGAVLDAQTFPSTITVGHHVTAASGSRMQPQRVRHRRRSWPGQGIRTMRRRACMSISQASVSVRKLIGLRSDFGAGPVPKSGTKLPFRWPIRRQKRPLHRLVPECRRGESNPHSLAGTGF